MTRHNPTATSKPDLSTYLMIHRLLRDGARRLADGALELDLADRHQVRAFATYWQGYATWLNLAFMSDSR